MTVGDGVLVAAVAVIAASSIGFVVWRRFRREVLAWLNRIAHDVRLLVERDAEL